MESVSLAASDGVPDDTRVLITDTKAKRGYPISAFTYLILFREQAYDRRSRHQAQTLVDYLWWAIHDGQRDTKTLNYAPLPRDAVQKAEKILKSITYELGPIRPTGKE